MLLISFTIVVTVIKNGDFNDINDIHIDIKTFKMTFKNVVRKGEFNNTDNILMSLTIVTESS